MNGENQPGVIVAAEPQNVNRRHMASKYNIEMSSTAWHLILGKAVLDANLFFQGFQDIHLFIHFKEDWDVDKHNKAKR